MLTLSQRMFSVDDTGEIRLRDLSLLNSSTAHLVAVATDNGLPPRQVYMNELQFNLMLDFWLLYSEYNLDEYL